MKTITGYIAATMFLVMVTLNAKNTNSNEILDKFPYKMQLNDVFYVWSDYIVYEVMKPQTKNNDLVLQLDTLKAGSKFKLTEATVYVEKDFVTEKDVEHIYFTIELEDGTTRRILHPQYLHTQCYREGESTIPVSIHSMLTDMLNYKATSFWYTFLICLTVSLLYLYQIKRLDKLFYKLLAKKRKIYNPGYTFFFAAGVLGAISGILIFFADIEFKLFFMYFPVLSFPSEDSLVIQYFWLLQVLIPAFFFWGVYRNISEFGVKFGLIRSVVLLVAGLAFFWTGVAIALIAIGLLIFRIGTSMANTIASQKYKTVVERSEFNVFSGEEKKVRVTLDGDGKEESRKYIE